MKKILYILWMGLFFCQCSSGDEKTVRLKNLSKFPHTRFVATLENKLPAGKNAVYAASVPYAWSAVQALFEQPIEAGKKASDNFRLLNQTFSYKKSLHKEDYSAEALQTPDGIIAKAFFHKQLPFRQKFDRLKKPLLFGKKKLLAFGMKTFDSEMAKQVEILYYKNDNEFIVKLVPQEQEHEIILFKKAGLSGSFRKIFEEAELLTEEGNKEKYVYGRSDKLAIPVIRFNIETKYKDLSNQPFSSNNQQHKLIEFYQRNQLSLDESGAVVESEAIAMVDSTGAPPVKKLPKKLIFDKPFCLFIKRADASFPYFGLKVENTELLTKYK